MFIQIVINGILLGGVYGLAAAGLALIFGVLKIVNFAHGEFLMVGMYLTYILTVLLGVKSPVVLFVTVPLMMFLLGLVTEKILIRNIKRNNEMAQIFITVGLGLVFSNLALILFGGDFRSMPINSLGESFSLGGIMIGKPQFISFVIAAATFILLECFLKFTLTGTAIRAAAQDEETIKLMGVNSRVLGGIAFGLGIMLTGIASVSLATMFPVYPAIGGSLAVICFVIVVLGGLDNILGTFLGGIIIGGIEALSGFYIDPGWKDGIVFVVFIICLLVRPEGIFFKPSVFGGGSLKPDHR